MEKLKLLNSILLGGLLALMSWATIEGSLLLRESRQAIKVSQPAITTTLNNIEKASVAVAASAKDLAETSQKQKELLTDEKTQRAIGLLIRSGDDVNRTVKKINVLLDSLNYQTLPRVNLTLDSTEQTITASKQIIIKLGNQTELILSDTDKTIAQLFQLLSDPNVKRAIAGVADTSESVSQAAFHVQVSAKEVQSAIPELVNSLKAVGDNADLGSQEVAKFLTGLNKPLSRKQKVFRFLLEAIIKSSPALLRR